MKRRTLLLALALCSAAVAPAEMFTIESDGTRYELQGWVDQTRKVAAMSGFAVVPPEVSASGFILEAYIVRIPAGVGESRVWHIEIEWADRDGGTHRRFRRRVSSYHDGSVSVVFWIERPLMPERGGWRIRATGWR